MYDANLVRLCFPDPPTPTNNAFPWGVRIIRDILIKWMIASCVLREKEMKRSKNNIRDIQPEAHHQATVSQQLVDFSGDYAKDLHPVLIKVNKRFFSDFSGQLG